MANLQHSASDGSADDITHDVDGIVDDHMQVFMASGRQQLIVVNTPRKHAVATYLERCEAAIQS